MSLARHLNVLEKIVINHPTVQKIAHKLKIFKATYTTHKSGCPNNFTVRAEGKILEEVYNRLLLLLVGKCMTIRKRLHKFIFYERCARIKYLFSRKSIKPRLQFAKDQDVWKTGIIIREENTTVTRLARFHTYEPYFIIKSTECCSKVQVPKGGSKGQKKCKQF